MKSLLNFLKNYWNFKYKFDIFLVLHTNRNENIIFTQASHSQGFSSDHWSPTRTTSSSSSTSTCSWRHRSRHSAVATSSAATAPGSPSPTPSTRPGRGAGVRSLMLRRNGITLKATWRLGRRRASGGASAWASPACTRATSWTRAASTSPLKVSDFWWIKHCLLLIILFFSFSGDKEQFKFRTL